MRGIAKTYWHVAPDGSRGVRWTQMASDGFRWLQMAFWVHLEVSFWYFWGLVAKWLDF